MEITTEWLRERSVRAGVVRAFRRRWPHGTTVKEVATAEWRSPRRGEFVAWLVRRTVRPELLAALAADRDWRVRAEVARRADAPPAVLAALAGDADADVRCAVARNRATPAAALERLAADDADAVRRAVAEHPATPLDAIVALARDVDPRVRRAARWW